MGSRPFGRTQYDVVIAGARCAGASTALLLARLGLQVLVVDPVPYGRDTLSTHALMRGGVLQLHRWGLLDRVRTAGTPPIATTTFHYGDEVVEVAIKARDGVEALFAPRRTVLDPILVDAAREAGAEVVHGWSVVGLEQDADERVRGARLSDADRTVVDVGAALVIGADGIRSRVARILDADVSYSTPRAACSVYGYWRDVPLEGFHWFYEPGVSIGAIPTNEGATCLFALLPSHLFQEWREAGLEALFQHCLGRVSTDLARWTAARAPVEKLRAFAGVPGFLRRATGPGWALVGDAGYFRDPITAHGISDALREAELLSRAVADGDEGLDRYQAGRDIRVRGLMDITDRIASFEWDLDEAKALHFALSREMNAQVDVLLALEGAAASH